MGDSPALPNRLDAALDRLEAVIKDRIVQPMRHLREAIQQRREQGGFDEDVIVKEIEKIAFHDRMKQVNSPTQIGEEIEVLANRILKEKPQ